MNIRDLIFIFQEDPRPGHSQCEVCLEDGTKVGRIERLYGYVCCHPYDLSSQEFKVNQNIYETWICAKADISDDIVIDCAKQICRYHNELSFLNMVLS